MQAKIQDKYQVKPDNVIEEALDEYGEELVFDEGEDDDEDEDENDSDGGKNEDNILDQQEEFEDEKEDEAADFNLKRCVLRYCD